MSYLEKVQTLLAAEPQRQEREVKWVWRSQSQELETLEHTGEPVGVHIPLRISHDSKRKTLKATLSKAHWKNSDSPGFSITFMSPFDAINYPSFTVATMSLPRYSGTQARIFEEVVRNSLAQYCETSQAVSALVDTALTYQ